MSQHFQGEENAYISGQPGTTGREPFENSTASGPGAQFASGQGVTGAHSGEHHLGQSGLTGDHQHVSGLTGGHQHGQGLTGQGLHGGETRGEHQHGTGVGASAGGLGGVGDHGRFGQSGNTEIDEAAHESRRHGDHHHGASGATGTGIAAAAADRATGHSHQGEHGILGSKGDHNTSGLGRSDKGLSGTHDDHNRVGDLHQDSGKYDRTGAGGPTTSGAAGTDRFDTDKSRIGAGGVGSHGTTGLHGDDQSRGFHKGEHDVDERGAGKGTGGIGGILGTTDKEFTARDRLGTGAYHDDNAAFQGNTSGPGGNTALTGREGTQEHNPVAQAKSRAGEDVNAVHGSGQQIGSTAHPEQKDKGLMEKIKDHLPI